MGFAVGEGAAPVLPGVPAVVGQRDHRRTALRGLHLEEHRRYRRQDLQRDGADLILGGELLHLRRGEEAVARGDDQDLTVLLELGDVLGRIVVGPPLATGRAPHVEDAVGVVGDHRLGGEDPGVADGVVGLVVPRHRLDDLELLGMTLGQGDGRSARHRESDDRVVVGADAEVLLQVVRQLGGQEGLLLDRLVVTAGPAVPIGVERRRPADRHDQGGVGAAVIDLGGLHVGGPRRPVFTGAHAVEQIDALVAAVGRTDLDDDVLVLRLRPDLAVLHVVAGFVPRAAGTQHLGVPGERAGRIGRGEQRTRREQRQGEDGHHGHAGDDAAARAQRCGRHRTPDSCGTARKLCRGCSECRGRSGRCYKPATVRWGLDGGGSASGRVRRCSRAATSPRGTRRRRSRPTLGRCRSSCSPRMVRRGPPGRR